MPVRRAADSYHSVHTVLLRGLRCVPLEGGHVVALNELHREYFEALMSSEKMDGLQHVCDDQGNALVWCPP